MVDRHAEFDLLVIIVSYRTAKNVRSLLASISPMADSQRVRFTVVDNADEEDLDSIERDFPSVELIKSGTNAGYSAAINLALKASEPSSHVLVLNPDLDVSPAAIRELITFSHKFGYGCVVPRILDSAGREVRSLRREPTVLNALGESLLGDHWASRPALLTEVIRTPIDNRVAATRCDWAVGAAVLLQSDALDAVGSWDERFFLYSEEIDYMHRLRAAGYEIWQCPTVYMSHEGGGSGSSADLVALLHINRLRYFLKWHHPVHAVLYAATALLGLVLRIRRPGERRALAAILLRSARSSVLARVGFPRPFAWRH